MKNEGFERGLFELSETVKRSKAYVIGNAGKIIALIAATVAILATFMEISFFGIGAEAFTTTLAVLLISGYVIYFSLEDAGEHLGEQSAEFKAAKERYLKAKSEITPEMIPALRSFCSDYSAAELEYRRKSLLCSRGYSEDDLKGFGQNGTRDRTARRTAKAAARLRAFEVTPALLLSETAHRTELYNPEKTKLLRMSLKLLPSTLCMLLTASVILTARADMSAAVLVDGIIKLSALPILGFKGYEAGYAYTVGAKRTWLETKSRLLECFLDEYEKKKAPEPPSAA